MPCLQSKLGHFMKKWRLDITMHNGTLPGDWKKATVIPIHKGVIDH